MKTITGKTLIKLGYSQSAWFGEALKHLNQEVRSKEYIVNYCDGIISLLPKIQRLLDHPAPYDVYIEANNKDEEENVTSVLDAMDRIMITPTIINGAIMPDACPVGGDNIPVGGVAVTKNTIHPMMHSSDVCCSVATSELSVNIDMSRLLDEAMKITHFGQGGRKGMQYGLEDDVLYQRIINNYFTKDYVEKACSHLMTQGDGNHFLFVGRSEKTGKVHIVTHHGSRGFGASVYKKGLHEAQKHTKNICPDTKNPWFDYNTDIGKEYWIALQIIKDWTSMNHKIIHNRILNAVGSGMSDFYWNEHNFVFKYGDNFYHAKGSTPMDGDRFDIGFRSYSSGKRLIPLNMAQPVLVVENHKDNTFGFAPHGAGRNLSRSAFQKRVAEKDLQKEISHLDIRFYSGKPDLSEFPSAYKNADEVIRQIEKFKLANIVDKILPYGCIMAGKQPLFYKR